MSGPFIFLILLAIGCILCGPVALIISIIALNKLKAMYREPGGVGRVVKEEEVARPAVWGTLLLYSLRA